MTSVRLRSFPRRARTSTAGTGGACRFQVGHKILGIPIKDRTNIIRQAAFDVSCDALGSVRDIFHVGKAERHKKGRQNYEIDRDRAIFIRTKRAKPLIQSVLI